MELTIKVNREDWNRFILENSGSFLQSWEWGEFQESVGRRVFRLAVPPSSAGADLGPLRHSSSEASEAMPAQFIENTIPVIKKKYWYCPKGPTMSRTIRGQEFRDRIKDLIDEIKKNSPPNVIFFRLGPEWEIGQGIEKNLENLGFKKLHYDIEPSQTLILDLNKTEEELLAQMHEKWRYNIRLAERKGVKIKMATSQDANFEKSFEEFYKLVDEGTSARKEIKHHPKEYYRKQFLIEGKNPPQPSLKGGSDSPPLGGVRGDLICKKRLGLIAEEAPREVLSVSGDSISLYDLASFTLAGVKALNVKTNDLEKRIKDLESQSFSQSLSTLGGDNSFSVTSLSDILKSLGAVIENGWLKVQNLTARTILIEKTDDPKNNSIGEGVIKSGETEAKIASDQIKNNSKVFITFRNDYGSRWWLAEQGDGFFVIKIAQSLETDVNFDWWVIGIVEPFVESSGSISPSPSFTPEPSASPQSAPSESPTPTAETPSSSPSVSPESLPSDIHLPIGD